MCGLSGSDRLPGEKKENRIRIKGKKRQTTGKKLKSSSTTDITHTQTTHGKKICRRRYIKQKNGWNKSIYLVGTDEIPTRVFFWTHLIFI